MLSDGDVTPPTTTTVMSSASRTAGTLPVAAASRTYWGQSSRETAESITQERSSTSVGSRPRRCSSQRMSSLVQPSAASWRAVAGASRTAALPECTMPKLETALPITLAISVRPPVTFTATLHTLAARLSGRITPITSLASRSVQRRKRCTCATVGSTIGRPSLHSFS